MISGTLYEEEKQFILGKLSYILVYWMWLPLNLLLESADWFKKNVFVNHLHFRVNEVLAYKIYNSMWMNEHISRTWKYHILEHRALSFGTNDVGGGSFFVVWAALCNLGLWARWPLPSKCHNASTPSVTTKNICGYAQMSPGYKIASD